MTATPDPPTRRSEPDDDRQSAQAIDMDVFVPAALTNLAQKITATASAVYRPQFGIGVTDWRIIALLAAEPWIAPVRICEATGLDKAAVSRSLRDLVTAGFVEANAAARNRRRVPVALTAKGLAAHDRIVVVARARQERLLKSFTPDERAQLRDFIARMRRELDALKDED